MFSVAALSRLVPYTDLLYLPLKLRALRQISSLVRALDARASFKPRWYSATQSSSPLISPIFAPRNSETVDREDTVDAALTLLA